MKVQLEDEIVGKVLRRLERGRSPGPKCLRDSLHQFEINCIHCS